MNRYAVPLVGVLLLSSVAVWGQEDGKLYQIKSLNSDKVLAPDGEGKLVQKTSRPKVKLQHWKLVKGREENVFQIVNVATGKVIASPSKEQAAPIITEAPAAKTKPSQMWMFEKRPRGLTIRSRSSDLLLDVSGFQTKDGAAIIQFTLNDKEGRTNQIWELVPVK